MMMMILYHYTSIVNIHAQVSLFPFKISIYLSLMTTYRKNKEKTKKKQRKNNNQ